MKSPFLSNLHHAYAQTDGTYAFPNSREGDMLKTAKREIERLHAELVELEDLSRNMNATRVILRDEIQRICAGMPRLKVTPPLSKTPAVATFLGYAVMPPTGWDDDFRAQDSLAYTADGAWRRFCYPALRREAYEQDGFRAVPVTVEIRAAHTVPKP
jgi:hypothetical protein